MLSRLRAARAIRAWIPDHSRMALAGVTHLHRNRKAGFTDDDHLREVIHWLERAQDATADGGVSGRYCLRQGWTSSYPETTGYIIPTFLKLAQVRGDSSYIERAERCVRFLLSIQLESGAFPGGEIAENRTVPSPFNSGQILHGLLAWHRHSGDPAALDAARRAADWMVSVQDADGVFRQYFYNNSPATYSAHHTCWLAEIGEFTGERRYLDAAGRHLDWVLTQVDSATAWFNLCGFDDEQHAARAAFTHTIAYTIFGVLHTAAILRREDGIDAARQAALRALRRCELEGGSIPGRLNAKWQRDGDFVCLTGNAQLALIWFRLFAIDNDLRYLNAAIKALDEVKSAQPMHLSAPGLRGGIAGSFPIWGDYIRNAVPNWSAKFFIDAMLEKREILGRLPDRQWQGARVEADRGIGPAQGAAPLAAPPTIVCYTSADSAKPAQILEATRSWGFTPAAVIVESRAPMPLGSRLRGKLRRDGAGAAVAAALARFTGRRAPSDENDSPGDAAAPPEPMCRQRGIPVHVVSSVNSPEALALIASLQPHLAVNLGAGILRKPLLAIPPLGTLNAHMGLLPYYRGMNVAEWSAINGDPVGPTVHLVDPGIDTGAIIATRTVDARQAGSIAGLRALVDRTQIALLAEVLEWICTRRALPAILPQEPKQGVQFFAMCAELRALLERKLKSASDR
jgi:folate-dependent phosphoribosylglycinamide formyltransferase PurN